MNVYIIIPARYGSTRLPKKMLLPLAGKPIVQRTYEQAFQANVGDVFIATDSNEIAEIAKQFDGKVLMTDAKLQSGTDRVADAASQLNLNDDDIVINLQGDEPMMPPELVQQLAACMKTSNHHMATLCFPMDSKEKYLNPNTVRVVRDKHNHGLYFSRAPIPWIRDVNTTVCDVNHIFQHIGIYAYRYAFLKQFVSWPVSPLEQIEQLEQLRALWHGASIYVDTAIAKPGIGIDTQEDFEAAEQLLANMV